MTEYERGAFEPAERVRVFDGSEDDEDMEGSRLPVLIVIALVVLVSFAGVVWLAYEKGVASGRSEPRIASLDSNGQPAAQYKGLKIYEQPAPNDADVVTAASAAPKDNDTNAQAVPAAPEPGLRPPVTDTSAAKPTASPVHTDTSAAKPVAAPIHTNTVKPVIVASVPKKSVTAVPPPSPPAPTQAEPSTAPTTKSAYFLQIGSYKSAQEAADAWSAARAAHASVLEGLSPDVKQVDLGDKGTWFRLRLAPFADKTAANALCDKLKAEGGTCILAR
jgi:cell division protein FtsN